MSVHDRRAEYRETTPDAKRPRRPPPAHARDAHGAVLEEARNRALVRGGLDTAGDRLISDHISSSTTIGSPSELRVPCGVNAARIASRLTPSAHNVPLNISMLVTPLSQLIRLA